MIKNLIIGRPYHDEIRYLILCQWLTFWATLYSIVVRASHSTVLVATELGFQNSICLKLHIKQSNTN